MTRLTGLGQRSVSFQISIIYGVGFHHWRWVLAYDASWMGRRYKPHLRCAACRLHASLCVCALLPRLETRTRVVLIVHQLEVKKTTNTGLVAARCLPGSAVIYRGRSPVDGIDGDLDWRSLVPAGSRAAILYPHDGATPLDAFAAACAEAGQTPALLVPDGTWRQAGRTRARLTKDRGEEIPCVALPPSRPTDRRLRLPDRPEQMATLEALALALGVLEGPRGPAIEEALTRLYRVITERTLWTNGRIVAEAVTGGIPDGAQPHDPLGLRNRAAP
jgi:DTW domain-containing protein